LAVLDNITQFGSRRLSVSPSDAAAIASAPFDAIAEVRGYVIGPSGSFGFFANDRAGFSTQATTPFGLYVDALAVPAGAPFRIWLNHNQALWGLASIEATPDAPDQVVWATFTVRFVPLMVKPEERDPFADVLPGPNGNGPPPPFVGPRPVWTKG